MESIINLLTSNPTYMAVAVILALFIVVGVVKKIIKLVLFVSAIFILYIAYLSCAGHDIPKTTAGLKESVSESIESIKKSASESLEEVKASAQKSVEEKVGQKVEGLFDGK